MQKAESLVGVQLGIGLDDPVIERFTNISTIFAQLKLPLSVLPPARLKELYASSRKIGPETIQFVEDLSDPPDFRLGVDFFFGRYQGEPRSVSENAAAAEFQGRRGVEKWRIMKSVAFARPDGSLVIMHLRGDRQVETNLPSASESQLQAFGLEYGTVNPFVRSDSVTHIFDRDLVSGEDYPGDDLVFTSSGDPRFFVGFNIRRYITALSGLPASRASITSSVSRAESGSRRVIARRPICVIGGDSGIDTARFGETVLATITRKLERAGKYFGDRSLPKVRLLSDPAIAGSINTTLYGEELRAHIALLVDEFKQSVGNEKPRHKELVTCSSTAMHGSTGDILRKAEEIEYVGPQEAIEHALAGLAERGVEVAHTVLLGLSSVYDKRSSAFAGEILNNVLPVNSNVLQQIQSFIQEQKVGQVDPRKSKLYRIIESILRSNASATSSSFDGLRGQNIVVVLGASELESFISNPHEVPEIFEITKSADPDTIKGDLAKARDNTIRLILISPSQALADVIAQKTLEPAA